MATRNTACFGFGVLVAMSITRLRLIAPKVGDGTAVKKNQPLRPILVRGTRPITDEQADGIMHGEKIEPIPYVCHSFVTDGKIQFLNDCTHELAGQTVDLPEIE